MRAGMRAGGQKNGTVTSMPRGFERICLVLGASCIWTFIVVPARIYGGPDPVRPSAARLPEQCFQNAALFLARWGRQALDGFHQTLDRSAQAIDFIEPAIGGDAFPPLRAGALRAVSGLVRCITQCPHE